MTRYPAHAYQQRGFTLIELLVVIAIIGILSAIVLASLSTARTKGQDAARISDVKSLETAMELYYNDNQGYPKSGMNADTSYAIAQISSLLVPKDIASIPIQLTTDGDQYAYGSSGASYAFEVYIAATNSWCKTGVNINAGWWGIGVPTCNF